jgi:hypothetical protein
MRRVMALGVVDDSVAQPLEPFIRHVLNIQEDLQYYCGPELLLPLPNQPQLSPQLG